MSADSRRARAGAGAVVAASLLLAACSSSSHDLPVAARSTSPTAPGATSGTPAVTSAPITSLSVPAPTTTAPVATTTTPTTAVPGGWSVVSSTAAGPAAEEKALRLPDGVTVDLLRMLAGRTVFDLHVGTTDPPGATSVPVAAAPVVSAAQRPLLLAAFNGGFQTSTGSGGFEVDGMVLKPLGAGLASLVIDHGGAARVAVWGQGVPRPGESVASVRQNLPPLVTAGRPAADAASITAWGATLHGVNYVARSALCSDGAGNLVYAGSTYAVPVDLSTALIDAGCVTAMELDINPEWVQADVAASPGAPLAVAVPGQSRPASQYLTGWTRDFVTVQAAP